MLKEFGHFMMRAFGDEQIQRCFTPSLKSSRAAKDKAIDLCMAFFADMSESLFADRLEKYNTAMGMRAQGMKKDGTTSTSYPSREELLESVLALLSCHGSGSINSQELFCFGRCISAALSMHTRRTSASKDPLIATFEWPHAQQLLQLLLSCNDDLMRSAQFFSFFAHLTYNLPDGDFYAAIERFIALGKCRRRLDCTNIFTQ